MMKHQGARRAECKHQQRERRDTHAAGSRNRRHGGRRNWFRCEWTQQPMLRGIPKGDFGETLFEIAGDQDLVTWPDRRDPRGAAPRSLVSHAGSALDTHAIGKSNALTSKIDPQLAGALISPRATPRDGPRMPATEPAIQHGRPGTQRGRDMNHLFEDAAPRGSARTQAAQQP